MNLRGIDLNLLPILRSLLRERSVTAASRELGMSQPATSNALVRLRFLLKDPLLVKMGRAMRLTPHAEGLVATVEQACKAVEQILLEKAFDPARDHRQFVVALPDYMALLLAPFVMNHLVEKAPGIKVRFVGGGYDLHTRIDSGDIDLAIVARTSALPAGLCLESKFTDRIVGVVARDHPLAKTPPTHAGELEAWPWIGAEVWNTMFTQDDRLWPMIQKIRPHVTVSLSYLQLLPSIAAQTMGVTMVPAALASQIKSVVQFDLPGPALPIDLCQIWSPLIDADKGHRWFRNLLNDAMGKHFERTA